MRKKAKYDPTTTEVKLRIPQDLLEKIDLVRGDGQSRQSVILERLALSFKVKVAAPRKGRRWPE